MRRSTTVLMIAVVLVAALGAVPTAALAQSDEPTDGTATPTADSASTANETTESGELLSAVLAVQKAEIDGEIETRTFGIRVAEAATEDARADVVAERLAETEARVSSLERRKMTLEAARENGSLDEGRYRARIAGLAAETATVDALTNQTANVSADLPSDLLRERGVNATAIRTLATRSEELSGPEVARIARGIAGPNVGPREVAQRRGPPVDVPGRDATDDGNETSSVDEARDERNASDRGELPANVSVDSDSSDDTTTNGTLASDSKGDESRDNGSSAEDRSDDDRSTGSDAAGERDTRGSPSPGADERR